MSTIPTVFKNSSEHITLPIFTSYILHFLGLYNTLVYNHSPNKIISYTILIFMQFFHVSALITLLTQENFTNFTFSIPTFIPLIAFTIYLLLYYFPSWAFSVNLKTIMKNNLLANKFNNIMFIFMILELVFCVPMYIFLIAQSPTSFWQNDNFFLNFFAKFFTIFIIPYGIITHTYLALLYSTLIVFTEYTCNSIKEYSKKIKSKITNEFFVEDIKNDNLLIENWCQSSYELIGKPIGFLSTIVGLCIITSFFIVLFYNQNNNIITIDSLSIIIYGSLIDFILYKTSQWHTTFNQSFEEWKNNIEFVPAINKHFTNILCFDNWLEKHNSNSFKLFGRNGIKVDYNLILKLLSLSSSVFIYVASKFFQN